jgi:hypothetical protein
VRGAVVEFGQDHFARGQLVGEHGRILAPRFRNAIPVRYNQVPTPTRNLTAGDSHD